MSAGSDVSSGHVLKPVLIISDVHLGAVPPHTERELWRFLEHAATHASGLLINGDLFDVMIATAHFAPRQHVRTLGKLADLVDSGVPVWFVGGNHDALEYHGDLLRADIGIQLLTEPAHLQLGRFRTLVIHGDGVHEHRLDYQKRHPMLRSRWFRWLTSHLLHIDWLFDVVARSSATPKLVSRHDRGDVAGATPAAALLETWAQDQLRADATVDLVLAGHSHVPAWKEIEPGRYYVNTGDWISHMTYGLLPSDGGAPVVLHWPDRLSVLPVGDGNHESAARRSHSAPHP